MAWWADHREIVGLTGALFGAGGVAAIFLQWLLRDRGKKPVEAPTAPVATRNINSRARGGGVSVVNVGEGSVSVEHGQTASVELMHAWQRARGIAGRDFATLLRAAEHAGLTLKQMEQIAQCPGHEREFEALRDVVSQRNVEAAARQLKALAERAGTGVRSD